MGVMAGEQEHHHRQRRHHRQRQQEELGEEAATATTTTMADEEEEEEDLDQASPLPPIPHQQPLPLPPSNFGRSLRKVRNTAL